MVKVCERHICFLRRGTTYEWVSQRQCDLCNFTSLPQLRAIYVYDQIDTYHLASPFYLKKRLNKPKCTLHNAEQTKSKEE